MENNMKTIIDQNWLDTHEWMLRSSNNGISYGGFKWPGVGKWTECPDWNTKAECGSGFHGNAPEGHGYGLDYSHIELCETKGKRVIVERNKIKVQHARIVAIGAAIPDGAFVGCGYKVFRVTKDCEISPKAGEFWIIEAGRVTVSGQSGGYCRFYDASTGTVSGQSGGYCRFYDASTGTGGGQRGRGVAVSCTPHRNVAG